MLSAATLAGWGLALCLVPTIGAASPFAPLINMGWTRGQLGAICLIAGGLWWIGILINGNWHRSPVVRTVGSVFGCMAWMYISYLLIMDFFVTGVVPLTLLNAVPLVVADLMSAGRNARQAVNADAEWRAEQELRRRNVARSK